MPSAVLRDFVLRYRDAGYPAEFPYKALAKLDGCDADTLAVLVDMLAIADRDADAPYDGEDLRRKAAVLRALATCEPSPATLRAAVDALRSVMSVSTSYPAEPTFPAPDNIDRGELIEMAQDHLAMACVVALFHQKLDDKATALLREVERNHRAFDVRQAARAVMSNRGRSQLA